MNEQSDSLRQATFVLWNDIDPNPYQPRLSEDPAVVAEIASSIEKNGLMQIPTARRVDGRVQLAFGHTRLAAYKLLGGQGKDNFSLMPLILRELTDLQMFELGVAENIKRRDLNPIETATSMRVYMDGFGKNSEEAAAFFNVSAETVRGTIRLLNLPEPIQKKVESGELSQNAARKLLTIARVDKKQVEAAAARITTGVSSEDAIEVAMSHSDNAFSMWDVWNDGKPKAGEGLWPLDLPPEKFPGKDLPALDAVAAAKALDLELTAKSRSELDRWIGALKVGEGGFWNPGAGIQKIEGNPVQFLINQGAPVEIIERLAHLMNPPACTACPFHAVADRQHYCGFKACHKRKQIAWSAEEIQKISKRLNIPVFHPATDGKEFIPLAEHTYQDSYASHAELVKDRDPDLRLQINRDQYSEHTFTKSHMVRVVLVGTRARKVKEKGSEARATERTNEQDRQKQYQLQRAIQAASRKFVEGYAVNQFASLFKGLDNIPVMAALARVEVRKGKNTTKVQLLAQLRAELADRALEHLNGYNWQLLEKGPVAAAKYLQGVATTWGVKLPADFLDVAQGHQLKVTPLRAASAETKKSKKE